MLESPFLPKLVDVLPIARLNLALLYMREKSPTDAYRLLQRFQPTDTTENILRANVWLACGAVTQDTALVDEAQRRFAEIGDVTAMRT
jgi:intraflagellar transport protein 56